jgi:hypothetical protein
MIFSENVLSVGNFLEVEMDLGLFLPVTEEKKEANVCPRMTHVILITRIPFIDLIADGGTSVFKIFAVF